MRVLILSLIFAMAGVAGEMPRFRTWKASVAFYGVATGLDIASSYGHQELNPVFGQRFDGRDAALKANVVAGICLAQYVILRKFPERRFAKVFAAMNFGLAGGTTAMAVRNWRIQ